MHMPDSKAIAPNGMWRVAPCFVVDDIVTTANFYRDKLGFQYERFWGEPPCFTMLRQHGAILMLSQPGTGAHMHPNRLPDPEESVWDAYFWIDDADVLYARCQANGVKIVRPICDQEYGMRDFDVEDCNGFRLCFGHDISS
jgi:predicted enzyme related to lactoylglutathione lyase